MIDEAVSLIYWLYLPGDSEPDGDSKEVDFWNVLRQTWSTTGSARLERLRAALEVCPDDPDVHFLLSQGKENEHLRLARELYEKTLQNTMQSLGSGRFERSAGRFWQESETRPYMRARAGLARCLWLMGDRKQALEHFFEMLSLNPRDHQGIRYLVLAHSLLEKKPDRRFTSFFEYYDQDKEALWQYTNALRWFSKGKAPVSANKSLKKALRANPFVPFYLLGRKKPPALRPPVYYLGDENEAIHYAMIGASIWRATPGAINWLATARDFLATR